MKKSFVSYVIGWLAALGLFNLITFITPNEIDGESKFHPMFWVAYGFITLFFIAQLACTYSVFRANSMQKTFYNLPLINISIFALITMLVAGGICMAVIQIPVWIGIIICSVVLAVNIISAINATMAITAVNEIDKKVKTKTMFIKMLTVDAQTLMTKADGDQMLEITKKVFEAIRYSDPMSDPALTSVEDKISEAFANFSVAVENNSIDAAQNSSKALLSLISERNTKCKILK